MNAQATVRRFYGVTNGGDASLLDGVLEPNREEIPLHPGQGPWREGLKPVVARLQTNLFLFETHRVAPPSPSGRPGPADTGLLGTAEAAVPATGRAPPEGRARRRVL